MRWCRNSRLAISVTSEEERKKMGAAIQNLGDRLSVTEPRGLKPLLRLVVVTPDMTDANIIEALRKQNGHLVSGLTRDQAKFKVVRRIKVRTGAVCNVVIEVTPLLWNYLRDKIIRLGYQIVPAVDPTPFT